MGGLSQALNGSLNPPHSPSPASREELKPSPRAPGFRPGARRGTRKCAGVAALRFCARHRPARRPTRIILATQPSGGTGARPCSGMARPRRACSSRPRRSRRRSRGRRGIARSPEPVRRAAWTPRAAVRSDGLWLDLGGVAHLFGGEGGCANASWPIARGWDRRPHRRRRHRRPAHASPASAASVSSARRRRGGGAGGAAARRAPPRGGFARRRPPPQAGSDRGAGGTMPARRAAAPLRIEPAGPPRPGAGPGRRAVRTDRPRGSARNPAPLRQADRRRRGDRGSDGGGAAPAGAEARALRPAVRTPLFVGERIDRVDQIVGSAPPAPLATAPISCAAQAPDRDHRARLRHRADPPRRASRRAPGRAADRRRARRGDAEARSGAADRPPRRPAGGAAPLPAERGRKRRAGAQRPPPRPAWPDICMAALAAPGPAAVAARTDRQCPGPASRPAASAFPLARPAAYRVIEADWPERIHGEWWKRSAETEGGARLFPGRGRGRPPLLAVPPRRRQGRSAAAI